MKTLSLAFLVALGAIPAAEAQQARIVSACGSIAPFGSQPAGGQAYATMDVNGNLCTNATSGGGGGGGVVQQGAVDATGGVWAFDTGSSGNLINAIKGSDPCTSAVAKSPFLVTSTSAATAQIAAPNGSLQTYICSISIIIGTPAVHVSLIGGTGATCATGTPIAILGSTTAANGAAFPVNGGMTQGGGVGTVYRTTTGGHGVCITQDGTTPLAFGGTYVQQ